MPIATGNDQKWQESRDVERTHLQMSGPVSANQMTGPWGVSICAKDLECLRLQHRKATHSREKEKLLIKPDSGTVTRTFEGASTSTLCIMCMCLRRVNELQLRHRVPRPVLVVLKQHGRSTEEMKFL